MVQLPEVPFDAQSILGHQLRPALVVDAHGVVVATNDGSCRLIPPTDLTAAQNDASHLLNKTVSELGLVPLPGDPPVLWTWNEVFRAARSALQPEQSKSDNGPERDHTAPRNVAQDTNDFWNNEARVQGIIEIDVFVTRRTWEPSLARDEPVKSPSMIKARATIQWLPRDGSGHFIIKFCRATLPRAPVPTPMSVLAEPVSHMLGGTDTPRLYACYSCHSKLEQSYSNTTPPAEGSVPDEFNVPPSVIPFILATINTDGQVTNLSESWYRFSGLDEEGSLGNGWIASIHPDDIVDMTKAWSSVLRTGRSHWSHQARYRNDSSGKYCWFLIRAQPYRDANGKVLRWYASMMDIDEWVLARLEAERRRQVMLTLFSQTDTMLWGVDTSFHMYICEGRLGWDPSIIETLAKKDMRPQSAPPSDSSDQLGCQELVITVRRVLQGELLNPIVEHVQGDRYFRTRLVAERTADGESVQAVLALTFDVTDEKARTVLRVENERLISNEKVSIDANRLRGRFLANVSSSKPSYGTCI